MIGRQTFRHFLTLSTGPGAYTARAPPTLHHIQHSGVANKHLAVLGKISGRVKYQYLHDRGGKNMKGLGTYGQFFERKNVICGEKHS